MKYPQNIEDMIGDFTFLDDWEDRYMHVIEMGKSLEGLTDDEHNTANKVNGCVSQVWLVTSQTENPVKLKYRGDSDAHIVKGLVAIAIEIFSGRTPQDIIAINAVEILNRLGLSEHLSVQRSNGLSAMIHRIQTEARTHI
ncbi:MAG: SufE family protein [Robiginitomaculum sp.]|nr:SufE family protein [Robiginitomaculum sp.]